MYTLQALQIFIFLIPGFIAATTLDHLIIRNTKKELERIIEALMFSMIIYTIYSLAFGAGPISFDEVNKSIMFDSKSFVFLSLISLIIPIIFSFLITNDLHMSIARKLQITRRSSRHSVWYDTFCDNQKYIIINFENGSIEISVLENMASGSHNTGVGFHSLQNLVDGNYNVTFGETTGLNIVNGTIFGLTGAIFSKNEKKLERARNEFHAGNLYINRKCTGALVGVQPFGGFNMSGTDSKAGSRDYLLLFMQGKSVCKKII